MLELTPKDARKNGKVTAGPGLCIDSGSNVDVVEDIVIRDRRHISEDGIVLPIITINKLSGKVESQPEVVTRADSLAADDDLIENARQVVSKTLDGDRAAEEDRPTMG